MLACLVALLVAVALSGCSFRQLEGTNGKQYVGGDDVIQIAPSKRGAPVDAKGEDLDGNPLSLASYRGKVVMLNVWAGWCGPCRAEMPSIVALAQTFATDKLAGQVQVLGVNIRQSGGTDASSSYAEQAGMTFPSFYDPGSLVLLALSSKLGGPDALPSTIVLDKQGRLAALVLGAIPGQTSMREIVAQVADGG